MRLLKNDDARLDTADHGLWVRQNDYKSSRLLKIDYVCGGMPGLMLRAHCLGEMLAWLRNILLKWPRLASLLAF
ncbi:MAG: hypothetical protein LBL48_04255 [Azoarcus sp.]|nr:hypothetical protein [Azoarcus sp.]